MVVDVPGVDARWWHAATQCAAQHQARAVVGAVRDIVPVESPDDVAWQTGRSGMDVSMGT